MKQSAASIVLAFLLTITAIFVADTVCNGRSKVYGDIFILKSF